MSNPVLDVQDLKVHFFTDDGVAKAVDGVSFKVFEGKTLGVVGESGCGKSITSLATLGLVPKPGKIVGGKILFRGKDLAALTEPEMRTIRGNRISMIFQEPMTALNPILTIGWQIGEVLERHRGMNRKESRAEAIKLLTEVGIPAPKDRVDEYPHQLSGGMKQRVMIAMALACRPDLLIADEPTTALDVTVQAQILELLKRLQGEYGMAIMLITHDLGVIAEMADDVAVMYAGKVVERSDVKSLFKRRLHPYTRGLFEAIPDVLAPKRRLAIIPGIVPSALKFPAGCRFASRCPIAVDDCRVKEPQLISIFPGHDAACLKVLPETKS